MDWGHPYPVDYTTGTDFGQLYGPDLALTQCGNANVPDWWFPGLQDAAARCCPARQDRRRALFASTGEGIGKITRRKCLQIIHALTNADGVDGDTKFLGKRNHDATFG